MEENIIILDSEQADNARHIQLGRETKAFIICKAQLGDTYNNICKIVEKSFIMFDDNDTMDRMEEAFLKMDSIISELIGISVMDGIGESRYKEL